MRYLTMLACCCLLGLCTGLFAEANDLPGHHLTPGDLIQISVYDHDDLTVTVRVPNNGRMTYPLIGQIDNLIGRSIDDLAQEIQRRLEADFIVQAMVTATILEFGPRFVVVMGAVERTQQVELNPFIEMRTLQAIGQCGGFTDNANREGAQVIRRNPVHGTMQTFRVPRSDRPQDLADDVILRHGDIVIVPRLDRVYVNGEVRDPGPLNLTEENMTVSRAIIIAGDFGRYAREQEVLLIRAGETPRNIDVRAIMRGQSTEDPVLRPGDIVFVPQSNW